MVIIFQPSFLKVLMALAPLACFIIFVEVKFYLLTYQYDSRSF